MSFKSSLIFSNFDSVSICTPTDTHFVFLKKSLIANVKAIICEKPISYSIHELNQLSDLQKVSSSTVIVNYLRRFQPSYIDLKLKISEQQSFTELKSILIKYQKGFINNCSHAIDLIQFLFNKEINLDVLNKSIIDYKFSKNDPTISLNAFWNKIPINIVGISEISYPVFEIELFFNDFRISILESGQKIIFYPQQVKSITLPLKDRLNCIDNYMIPVIEKAEKVIKDGNVCSNLSESILLNKKMLEILSL